MGWIRVPSHGCSERTLLLLRKATKLILDSSHSVLL